MTEPGPLDYRLATAPLSGRAAATAAIAIIDLEGDPQRLRAGLPIEQLPAPGHIRLAHLPGIDDVLLCRISDAHLQIHAHAGPFVLHKLVQVFEAAGIRPADRPRPRTQADRLAYWLAHAPSPLAIDLLLAQPRLRRFNGSEPADPRLDRLLRPPLVVAVGPPNVGKSSLLNALAQRAIVIVSDQPGTTRDSVGALLDLDGLVVRWIDLPGLRETVDPIEQQAIARAAPLIDRADLILLCHDASSGPAPADFAAPPDVPTLTVRTKADLPPQPADPAHLSCSAITGEGLPAIARAISHALVPPSIRSLSALWDLPAP